MMKCALCKSVARMYCDSDQARLCWDCDSTVHNANFIVAKHTRTLLCHSCQSPTPWTGSGSNLSPTLSICESCLATRDGNISGGSRDPGNGSTIDEEDEDEDEEEEDEEEEDDGENQVVPLSLPPSSSSSCEETSFSRGDSAFRIFSDSTSSENQRFSYDDGVQRPGEKNVTGNIRSWRWR